MDREEIPRWKRTGGGGWEDGTGLLKSRVRPVGGLFIDRGEGLGTHRFRSDGQKNRLGKTNKKPKIFRG